MGVGEQVKSIMAFSEVAYKEIFADVTAYIFVSLT